MLSASPWEIYKSCLAKKPLLTKSVTSSVIMSVSDVLCQRLEQNIMQQVTEEKKDQDWRRTADVATTGFIYSGPISHTWYAILEFVVTVEDKLLGLVLRMLLDAFIFSPVAVTGYFTMRTILEGGGPSNISAKLQSSFLWALFASWKFWPCANIINFTCVPLEYRVLYNNMLSLFWNGYLSFVNNRSSVRAKEE